MKIIYAVLFFSFLGLSKKIHSQCAVFAQAQNSSCGCNGTLFSSGTGSPPLTYSWSPGGYTTQSVTGVCPGTYTVTLTDAQGCNSTSTAVVQNQGIFVNGGSQPSNGCTNCTGSVFAGASGGQPPYTYLWSPGGATTQTVTGMCPGVYTVVVTDNNNCTGSTTVTVNLNSNSPLVAVSTCGSSSCTANNGFAASTANGGTPPYSYLWNTGATTPSISGLSPACYTVTVTDAGGCTATSSCCVTSSNGPSISNVPVTHASCQSCCNGSAGPPAITGGTPPYTYLWSPTNQTTATATGLCPGSYTVCVTDANGCSFCTTTQVMFAIGMDENPTLQFDAYPNPASESITIQLHNENFNPAAIRLLDLTGRLVESPFQTGNDFIRLDLKGLSPGIYFLELSWGDKRGLKKIIKQ